MGVFRVRKQKLGKGFSDFLERRERIKGRRKKEERGGGLRGQRGQREQIGLILIFFLLLGRLFYLAVVRGAYYRDLAENNRVREERIEAPRGVIYDRKGRVLARNKAVYKKCQKSKVKSQRAEGRCQRLSREEALRREAAGEEVKVELSREYPAGEAAAHVVGYMGEVSQADLQNSKDRCQKLNKPQNSEFFCPKYALGEWRGVSGAEEAFEEILRGEPGKRLVEVDAQGREIRELGRIEPIPGRNIYLSIDLELQKVAAEELAGKKGAVVASDPATGEILALFSSPSFDPNLFIEVNSPPGGAGGGSSAARLEEILNDGRQPLFNRAIAGLYPPGSTFKIITAVAGLERGVIDEKTKIEDVGVIKIGPYRFPNWYFTQYGKKEGELDVVGAIQRSNDIFFYKVGEWVGIESLEQWAKRFKLNTKLGIELAGEAAGIVRRQRRWFLGDTYHTAIGQGDLLVTPLAVNFWTGVIANGGKLCRPILKKSFRVDKMNKIDCQDLGLSKKTVKLVGEGMRRACAPGGTGWPLFRFKVQGSRFKVEKEIAVACKTGTAEYGDSKGHTHAWLTAYAPFEKPQIALTVLVEGGGEGSSVAGPIVKRILEKWFQLLE